MFAKSLENYLRSFALSTKIIGNTLSNMPALNPNSPPFIPTSQYSLERHDRLDKKHPGNFLWPVERVLMHNSMLSHDSSFAWSDEERGSF
jgi:hypothetical protein